jgi:hypothetical protein
MEWIGDRQKNASPVPCPLRVGAGSLRRPPSPRHHLRYTPIHSLRSFRMTHFFTLVWTASGGFLSVAMENGGGAENQSKEDDKAFREDAWLRKTI